MMDMAPRRKIGQISDKNRVSFETYDRMPVENKARTIMEKLGNLGLTDLKIHEKTAVAIPLHERNMQKIDELHKANAGTDHGESLNRALSDWMFVTMKHKLVSLTPREKNGTKWYCLKAVDQITH